VHPTQSSHHPHHPHTLPNHPTDIHTTFFNFFHNQSYSADLKLLPIWKFKLNSMQPQLRRKQLPRCRRIPRQQLTLVITGFCCWGYPSWTINSELPRFSIELGAIFLPSLFHIRFFPSDFFSFLADKSPGDASCAWATPNNRPCCSSCDRSGE
jgi:hypothetical protein